jgi:hypothetical protein
MPCKSRGFFETLNWVWKFVKTRDSQTEFCGTVKLRESFPRFKSTQWRTSHFTLDVNNILFIYFSRKVSAARIRSKLTRMAGWWVYKTVCARWSTLSHWEYYLGSDYILITNLMYWLLFIHKIIFSSICFEHQVIIFRRMQLYTCSIWYSHSLWEFLVACRYTAWARTQDDHLRLETCRGEYYFMNK